MSKRREAGIYRHEKQSFSWGAPKDAPSSERSLPARRRSRQEGEQ
jgi:hypothetical protein